MLFIFTLFQTVQRHEVYIATYDMQILLLYYIVPICSICRKLTVIYSQLGNNHFIQLLRVFFIHFKLEITSATLRSKYNDYSLLLTQPMEVLDVLAATSKYIKTNNNLLVIGLSTNEMILMR